VAEELVTFTPSDELTPETEYTLSLTKGIQNLAGTGMEASVTSISNTRSRRWEIPLLLETDDAGLAQRPQIAVDQDGNLWRCGFSPTAAISISSRTRIPSAAAGARRN